MEMSFHLKKKKKKQQRFYSKHGLLEKKMWKMNTDLQSELSELSYDTINTRS